MKTNLTIALLAMALSSEACQPATSTPLLTPAGQVETRVAVTISVDQTATTAVEQSKTQVAVTLSAGRTSTATAEQAETQVAATLSAGRTSTAAAEQRETQVAATISAGQTSTAAIEQAVKMTLTASAPLPTYTPTPSPTLEPTTAIPPTQTPLPTATTKPTPVPTVAPTQTPTPQMVFLRPRCGTSYTVQADRLLEIRYGSWLALGADLAKQNAQHLTVKLVLDGEPVAGAQQPVVPGSEIPCGVGSTDAYGVFYVTQVGPLSAGPHTALVTWIFDEQVTDGGDVNGDGAPDLYGPGEVIRWELTIIAQ